MPGLQATLSQQLTGRLVVCGAQRQLVLAAGVERFQCILEHQLPFPYDAHRICHLVDLTEQMAGYHHRHAKLLGQAADQLPHLLDARRVQAVGGFIQDQQPRKAQQGGGQPQPLLHPQGIMGHFFAFLAVQPHDLQHFPDVLFGRAPQGLDDAQIFFSRQVPIIAGALDQAADLAQQLDAVVGLHRFAENRYRARRGLGQAQDHFERSGFACPVGA